MYSNETVQSFLRRCRKRMDQELDTDTNFWQPAEMVEYMNEGMREVWQSARETHQNWFVRQMRSTDGTKKIGGRDYDTSLLRIETGRTRLLLPPDFSELLLLENLRPVLETDNSLPQVIFEYANMTQRVFRAGLPEPFPTETRVFRCRYDVVFGPEGPYIFVAPSMRPGTDAINLDVEIAYIAMPPELTIKDSFEGTGFSNLMVDAVLAYACYAAVRKEDLSDNIASFERGWNLKRELATRAAGPKQTRDEETVEGYLEDEILY